MYLRDGKSNNGQTPLALVVVDLTPATYENYSVGGPGPGFYRECINTDSECYGGSNKGNNGGVEASKQAWQGQPCQLSITVPPLSTVIFEHQA